MLRGSSGRAVDDGGVGYDVLGGSGGREVDEGEDSVVPGRVELRPRLFGRASSVAGSGVGFVASFEEDSLVDSFGFSVGRGLLGSLGRTGLGFFGSEIVLR